MALGDERWRDALDGHTLYGSLGKEEAVDLAVAVAVDDIELRSLVEAALRRLSAEVVHLRDGEALGPQIAAIVCLFPSRRWESCVARLSAGGPVVPHVLVLSNPRVGDLRLLLSAPEKVRDAVTEVLIAPHLEPGLYTVLGRLLASSVPAGRIARIQDLVAGANPDLRRMASTILKDPRKHTTIARAIRDSNVSCKRARWQIRMAGFAPPSQFVRVVRTLGAHALLTSDATVEQCAQAMGYGSTDTLRHHFKEAFGMTPSVAAHLSLHELSRHLRRAPCNHAPNTLPQRETARGA